MSIKSTEVDEDWVVALLKKNVFHQKPVQITDVQVSYAVPLGDNFTSTIYRVVVKTQLGSGRSKKIPVIVKVAPSDELPISKVVKGFYAFRQEIKMYETFPLFEDLMEEFEDKREILWPYCYGYKPFTAMTLSDLQAEGFKTMNRKEGLNIELAVYAIRAQARFHAMSKILLERGQINRDEGKTHFLLTEAKSFRNSLPGCLKLLSSAIEESWDPKWKWMAKRIRDQIPLICDRTMEIMKSFDSRFEVLCHGDPWTTNLMWKFSEYDEKPIALRFVDFQFSIVNSLVFDLCYLMYLALPPKIRRENLKYLIQVYQESLENNLRFFKWKGYIPTVEDILEELERIQYPVFSMLIYSLPITSALSDNTYDLGKVLDHPPEVFLNKDIFAEDKYAKVVCYDFQDLCDKGVI